MVLPLIASDFLRMPADEFARAKIDCWLRENTSFDHRKQIGSWRDGDILTFRYECWTFTGKTCEYLFFQFNYADLSLRVYNQIDHIN